MANGSGTLKQMECSDDAWEMSETEIRLAMQSREGAGRDARYAQHAVAGHSDQGLPTRGRQGLDRKAPGLDLLRDLGPGRLGILERPDVDGDPPAGREESGRAG